MPPTEIPLPPEVTDAPPEDGAAAAEAEEPESENRGKRIKILPIVGQIEGHTAVPESVKSTKYERILPLLAAVEDSESIDGLLVLLNTVGGDVEAGLAIAEMLAGMRKPVVSLILGGGHSIGLPLACAAARSFCVRSATMTMHPVRFNGLVIGVEQSFEYFRRMQERIAAFVTEHSHITREAYYALLFATDKIAADMGTLVSGEEAVRLGLIDAIGSVSDALFALHEMIRGSAAE